MSQRVSAWFVLLAATAPTLPAQQLEEVIVTAQRREQSLQDVPFSITAFDGALIERANVKGAADYLALTPNVSFTEDGHVGSRGIGIAIRGVNNLVVSGENAVVNSVGIYLDAFSVASIPTQVANPLIPDMERVEVLRGPQGTYFGRNSLGGALNLTTKNPTDHFGGKIIIGGESYESAGEQFNFTGVLNLPLSERVRLRGVVYFEDSSGLVRNICAAGASAAECPIAFANDFVPNGAENSGHEYFMGRLKALWDVSERSTVGLTMVYADEEQGHDETIPSGILDLDTVNRLLIEEATDPRTGFWPENRSKLSHDRPERNALESLVAILNIQHRLSRNLALKSITGVLDAQHTRLFDNDLVGGADAVVRDNLYEGVSWSTELRLEGEYDRIGWTLGVLYAEDEQTQENDVATGVGTALGHDLDPPNGLFILPSFPAGLGLLFNHKSFKIDSVALFADATVRISDRLELTLGGRYTHDKVDTVLEAFGFRPTCCFPFSPGFPGPPTPAFFASFVNVVNPPAEGHETFHDFSPRFGLRYLITDDASVYGLVSKGYKAGGTSLGNSPTIGSPAFNVPFDAETLWNYEVGLKSEWFERRLRVNTAVFYLDWSDMQFEARRALTSGPVAPIVDQTINIDSAKGVGGEIELVAAPIEGLSIRAALGYQETEIESAETVVITGQYPVELQGLDLPQAPDLTANVLGEYRRPLASGEVWVSLEYIHRHGQYSDIEALTNRQTRGPAPATGLSRPVGPDAFPYLTPRYDLVNFRAGYDTRNWNLGFYIQNLTDEKYYTGTREKFGTSGIRLRPHPRVFGLMFSYRFGGVD